MTTIHCISGLGADHRVFSRLSVPGVRLVPVPWIGHKEDDDLPGYAHRLSATIGGERPVILGLSFGGMLAAEIARIRDVRRLFLLSSAKDHTELPPMNWFLRFLVRRRLLPIGIARIPGRQAYERFGAETAGEKALLDDILRQTDTRFAAWALKAIVEWRSADHTGNILHIHGTADRIIAPDNVRPDHWIEGGTHFMVYQRARELSELIARYL